MKQAFKITLFLIFIGIIGFAIGFWQRPVEITVRDANTNAILETRQTSGGSELTNNSDPGFMAGIFQTNPASIPWYISRSAAIVAYILMFLVIFLGTGMTTGFIYKLIEPLRVWSIHKNVSIALGVTVAIHVVSIFFDKFINFSLLDILVPFASKFKPVYLSLGIFSFYLLLIVIFSSIFLRLKSPKLWLAIHFLTYPIFIFSFVHGVFTGTDAKTMVMQVIYGLTGPIFVALIGYRFFIYSNQRLTGK